MEGSKCNECGKGTIVLKHGQHGDFLACDAYPACKHTENVEVKKSSTDQVEADVTLCDALRAWLDRTLI